MKTFGQVIVAARKAVGFDLEGGCRRLRRVDGRNVLPQYLYDSEYDLLGLRCKEVCGNRDRDPHKGRNRLERRRVAGRDGKLDLPAPALEIGSYRHRAR
jgi:hypothetical protein